ncbi:MAG TPA: class I SAM-dependent methyltransferase, partial [Candidatus Obscuribacterales bacterium]
MFASGESFSYFRCRACGCLQISEIPADLSRYYPKDYYSYRLGQASGPRASLRRLRNRGLLTGGLNPAGLLARLQPFEALAALKPLALDQNARILDVGCGQGQLVRALQELGYASAIGIDPFLEQ